MANHKSAIKRHRQSLKARERNRAAKTRIKNNVKVLSSAIESGDKDAANAALRDATSVIDRAAGKGVIHRRTAQRKIARLAYAVNKLSA